MNFNTNLYQFFSFKKVLWIKNQNQKINKSSYEESKNQEIKNQNQQIKESRIKKSRNHESRNQKSKIKNQNILLH